MSKYKMDNKTSTTADEEGKKVERLAGEERETDEDIQVVSRARAEATRHRSSLISPKQFHSN
jgi:hypothetical protein